MDRIFFFFRLWDRWDNWICLHIQVYSLLRFLWIRTLSSSFVPRAVCFDTCNNYLKSHFAARPLNFYLCLVFLNFILFNLMLSLIPFLRNFRFLNLENLYHQDFNFFCAHWFHFELINHCKLFQGVIKLSTFVILKYFQISLVLSY